MLLPFLVAVTLATDARSGIIEKDILFRQPLLASQSGRVSVYLEGCRTTGRAGTPALPVYPACFLIPQGERVLSVEVLAPGDDIVIQLDGIPSPVQAPFPPGIRPGKTTPPDPGTYSLSSPFPEARGVLSSSQRYSGSSLAWINLYPCRVVPSTGRLLFSPRLRVRITTGPGGRAPARSVEGKSPRHMRRIRSMVENPGRQGLPEYAPELSASSGGSPEIPYLIITSEELAASFEELSSLKEMMGLKTMIRTVESIAGEMAGADLQEQIRNYIIYAYQQYATEYVMLGGDVEVIPHRSFYVKAGTEIEPDLPSDLYYSALDGDWNADGDAYFGEPGEEDLMPEVALGRLPVSSPAEVSAYCAKLERYTMTPPPSSCTSALMLGELLWDDIVTTWGGDYKDEILFGTGNYGFTTAGVPAGFDYATLYDRDMGNWTLADLLPYLNGGVNLVNHLGHANIHAVMNLPIWEVASLSGSGEDWIPFVCYSQGCYPAAFDNRDALGVIQAEDAIGEQLVTSPAGAVAFIGNTRLGWGAPGSTSSVSQYFDRQFFDALFGEGRVMVGEAFDDSRMDNIPFIPYAAFRYVMYTLCLLGDPAMPVWRSAPQTLQVDCDSIFCAEQELHHVHVSSGSVPVEGARVSLQCASPSFYSTTFTDASGTAYLSVPPDTSCSAMLSVWAPDHLVHTDSISITPECEARLTLFHISVDDDSTGSSRGDGDGIIDGGEKIEFTLAVKNDGSSTAFNTILVCHSSDEYLTVYDDTLSLGDIPAKACLILDGAVVVELSPDIPDGYALELDFDLISEGMHWSTRHALDIVAPDLALYSWTVTDTLDGNGNGCLEGWEFLNIHTRWINNGSVDILNPVLNLTVPPGGWTKMIHRREYLPDIPPESIVSSEGLLQVFVREATPPFTDLTLIVELDSDNITAVSETLTVMTCGSDLNDDSAPGSAWSHEALTGFDGWHLSSEEYLSAPGSWKCGDMGEGPYSNMMDAVLVTPPLCLYENSSLTFNHRMEAEATETYPYWADDAGVVEISTDGGKTWTIINPTVLYPCRAASSNTIFLAPYQRCYSGTIDWKSETFDLSAYQGPVRLRFHFATNEQISYTGWFIDDIEVTTEKLTGDDPHVPDGTNALRSAVPNPFNPSTVIEYEVASRSPVKLTIYDVAGRRIRDLVDEVLDAGRWNVSWDGRDNKGSTVASGIYFLNMRAGVYSASMRLVLLR